MRRGTTCISDVLVTDLDAARHRGGATYKVLEKRGKKIKKYQEKCWDMRR